MIIPPEIADDKDIILECSAGVGGQEAMLFTSDILTMYKNYAAHRGWSFTFIDKEESLDVGKFIKKNYSYI